MGNEPNWLAAGDVEYRIRPWIIAAIFFAAFQFYQWDHVSAAGALAGWLTPAGGNVHATASLIFWIGRRQRWRLRRCAPGRPRICAAA